VLLCRLTLALSRSATPEISRHEAALAAVEQMAHKPIEQMAHAPIEREP
jgi:hypothetical protein